jgi:hypothetical protein
MVVVGYFFVICGAEIARSDQDLLPIVDEDLCQFQEVRVASCMLEGGERRIVSICADQAGKVYYYFGTRRKIELRVRFSTDRKIFRWINSDTYATFFGFNRGGYSYILEVPQEILGARATLYVKKSEELFDYDSPGRQCTNNSFGEKNLVSGAIENVDDKSIKNGGGLFPPAYTSKNSGQRP